MLERAASEYAVVLVNLGTPDEPTVPAVQRYLKQFLSDQRVVDYPAILWQCILRGIILPFRGRRFGGSKARRCGSSLSVKPKH